ncbi:hypothetical protein M0M57_05650 [Flavobacterium azooxidireducens]|uniref:VanZ-like domain-containing protein n=1 Tax=Flavobacterium azooxidireducens TaxID=1871076 RepID=A0ABY4KLN0_9FLAO|nr:hypothetical protein [Flavobacterium azooxidireducens]UPQ80320.1 hypothetical protein M0M57_05650 [Flavobacterium azooxidireducens]
MKKSYSFWLFLLLFVSAISVYLLQQNNYNLPKIINNYYNDLVALPIVLSMALWLARKIKSNPKLQLTFFQCLVMAMLFGWFFEIYLPERNPRYTADVIDFGLYAIGAVLFYGW